MSKIKNMNDFAQMSGLSRPTVAKYFSDPLSVRPTTRKRIEKTLEKFDYRPNIFAQNLKKKNPKNIGVIVPQLIDPFYAEIVRRIEMMCIEKGYWAVVLSSHGEAMVENAAVETLLALKLSGAIIAPLGTDSDMNLIKGLNESNRLVILDTRLNIDAPFVGTDNNQSISLIVDYLCRTGEAPCYMDMPALTTNAMERKEAYKTAIQKQGFEPIILTTDSVSWSFEKIGFDTANYYLDNGGFPRSTVLCANDRIAFGVMAAAYQRGMKVGRDAMSDLRVAGHDDHPLSEFTCPGLTTVAQDYNALADKSIELLLSEGELVAKQGDADSNFLYPSRLIMRESA
nr:LacI family DNA-binding transcriptional regulator [uncultured Cohaesibacter sp.]